jgi:hypothetical protein
MRNLNALAPDIGLSSRLPRRPDPSGTPTLARRLGSINGGLTRLRGCGLPEMSSPEMIRLLRRIVFALSSTALTLVMLHRIILAGWDAIR